MKRSLGSPCAKVSLLLQISPTGNVYISDLTHPAYGCTELSGPCVQSGVRDSSLPLSAAGSLVANSELRFLDTDGKDVGARGPGEITCRGPNVMMYVCACVCVCVSICALYLVNW